MMNGFKCGYVSIIGKPNVGKSTLLNKLLKKKIAIVSHKPQTTRHKILGILDGESYQILFLDTPGIVNPKYKLQESMLNKVHAAIADADIILFMVDPFNIQTEKSIISKVENRPFFLVINKIDLIEKEKLLPLIDSYKDIFRFDEAIPISALKEDGLDLLTESILNYLPEGKPFYPENQLSERDERFFVGEIVREKIFKRYGEEIPYSTAVVVDEFTERKDKKDYISVKIFVERDSQKKIIIGKNGDSLKEMGKISREEIEDFLGRKVYLDLWVKVRKNWRKKPQEIERFGY